MFGLRSNQCLQGKHVLEVE